MGERRLEVLDGGTCRALLASRTVGRLGIVRGGYPVVIPVNYGLHNDRVVIRTDEGAKLRAARYRRVSFEVDDFDVENSTGWSVLVQGFGTEVTDRDPADDALRGLPVTPWAPGERNRILVITPISVTGRRIVVSDG